jgi:small basic protein (TIGR04137 family)
MSMDRSLKSANSLTRHRNVLTRPERLLQLAEEEKWNDKKSVFGLPKVGHRKQELAKGAKDDAAAPGAEGAAGATPAAGAAAPGAKGAAPAAKGAAPAAKGAAPAKGAAAAAPAAKKK